MENKPLQGMKVAILVTNGFEQVELTSPKEALEKAGATTYIISPGIVEVQGFKHHEKADTFEVDIRLESVDADDFDAVVLPGGTYNSDALRMVAEAQEFVKKIEANYKPIAAICHGPWLLVSAGLVKGKKITSYHTIQDDLRNAGADWVDLEVVRDGNWVSSRSPKDLPTFNREMIALFAEHLQGRLAASQTQVAEETVRLH